MLVGQGRVEGSLTGAHPGWRIKSLPTRAELYCISSIVHPSAVKVPVYHLGRPFIQGVQDRQGGHLRFSEKD